MLSSVDVCGRSALSEQTEEGGKGIGGLEWEEKREGKLCFRCNYMSLHEVW